MSIAKKSVFCEVWFDDVTHFVTVWPNVELLRIEVESDRFDEPRVLKEYGDLIDMSRDVWEYDVDDWHSEIAREFPELDL